MRCLEVELKKRGRPIDRYSKEEQEAIKRFRALTKTEDEARESFLVWKRHRSNGVFGIEDLLGYGQRSWIANALVGPALAPVVCKSSSAPVFTAPAQTVECRDDQIGSVYGSQDTLVLPDQTVVHASGTMIEYGDDRVLVVKGVGGGSEDQKPGETPEVSDDRKEADMMTISEGNGSDTSSPCLSPEEEDMIIACEVLPSPEDPNFSLRCVDGAWLLESRGRVHLAATGPIDSLENMASTLAQHKVQADLEMLLRIHNNWARGVAPAVTQWEEVLAWSDDRWKYCRPSQVKLIKGSYFALSEVTELVIPRGVMGVDKVLKVLGRSLGIAPRRLSFRDGGREIAGMWNVMPGVLSLAIDGVYSVPPAYLQDRTGYVTVYHPAFSRVYCPLPYVWAGNQVVSCPRPNEAMDIKGRLHSMGVRASLANYFEVRMTHPLCEHKGCGCIMRVDVPRLNMTIKADPGPLQNQLEFVVQELSKLTIGLAKRFLPPHTPALDDPTCAEIKRTWLPDYDCLFRGAVAECHMYKGKLRVSGNKEGLWNLDGMELGRRGKKFFVDLPGYDDWYHMKHRSLVVFFSLPQEVEKKLRLLGGQGRIFFLFPSALQKNCAYQYLESMGITEMSDW